MTTTIAAALRSPSIACIGILGRHNNPLYISLFPATGEGYDAKRDELEYGFMLNSCLDIFEARMPAKTVGHDFGLLHALDERIAMYGWLTNTGVKLVIIVDMEGRPSPRLEAGKAALGLRTSDLNSAFQALQAAYIALLRNPFYMPDEQNPKLARDRSKIRGITSPRFMKEVKRIGDLWQPGAVL